MSRKGFSQLADDEDGDEGTLRNRTVSAMSIDLGDVDDDEVITITDHPENGSSGSSSSIHRSSGSGSSSSSSSSSSSIGGGGRNSPRASPEIAKRRRSPTIELRPASPTDAHDQGAPLQPLEIDHDRADDDDEDDERLFHPQLLVARNKKAIRSKWLRCANEQ